MTLLARLGKLEQRRSADVPLSTISDERIYEVLGYATQRMRARGQEGIWVDGVWRSVETLEAWARGEGTA